MFESIEALPFRVRPSREHRTQRFSRREIARHLRLSAVLIAVMFVYVPRADAALILTVTSGGVSACFPDQNDFAQCEVNPGGADQNLNPETILLQSPVTVNGLQIVNAEGRATFDPNEALTLTIGALVNTSGGILTGSLLLSGTGFFEETAATWTVTGEWGLPFTGSLVDFSFFNDPSNQQGAQNPTDVQGTALGGRTFLSANSLAISGALSQPFPILDADGYAMTLRINFSLLPAQSLTGLTVRQTTTQEITTPVPEPVSMLLLATGVLGTGVRRWRQLRS